jgi:hypothetical protein
MQRGQSTQFRGEAAGLIPHPRIGYSVSGRRIGEDGKLFWMARRFNSQRREQLDKTQLEELRTLLSAMPEHELALFYRTTLNACRYEVRLPSPRMIQELVQAWKQLRKVVG